MLRWYGYSLRGFCLWFGDLAHSIIEGQAENLDEEVDGVACQLALWPTPIAVLDEQALVSGQFKIDGRQLDELEASPAQQGNQRSHAGGADLLSRPAVGATGVVCRSHFASGVE